MATSAYLFAPELRAWLIVLLLIYTTHAAAIGWMISVAVEHVVKQLPSGTSLIDVTTHRGRFGADR
ncbi:hypothetical protein [Saccharothrix sp. HUAS TT1]|uniref:hypothetical protein n=1 Tax=unclassified Saccharothrix TaxID=2593673 RepID=UPI00345B5F5E